MARLHKIVVVAAMLAFGTSSIAFAEKDQGPNSQPMGSTKPVTAPGGGGMQHVNPAAMQNTNALKHVDMNGPAKIMQCQKECDTKSPKVDVAGAQKALDYAKREEKPNKTKIEKLTMALERAKASASERERNVRQCQSQCSAK